MDAFPAERPADGARVGIMPVRRQAVRVGTHDDLVTAIGLATQVDNVGPALVQPIAFAKVSNWRPTSEFLDTSRRPSDRPWHS